jgi:DsbC/DsbD-like thiol-disulfide interchange protein
MDGVMNGSMKITHSGCHVQAASLPQGDIPLRLTVDQIEGVDAEDITYPKPRAFRLAGLDDRRHVYEGKVQLQVPIHFGARESSNWLPGCSTQACTESTCLPPDELEFCIPLAYLGNL